MENEIITYQFIKAFPFMEKEYHNSRELVNAFAGDNWDLAVSVFRRGSMENFHEEYCGKKNEKAKKRLHDLYLKMWDIPAHDEDIIFLLALHELEPALDQVPLILPLTDAPVWKKLEALRFLFETCHPDRDAVEYQDFSQWSDELYDQNREMVYLLYNMAREHVFTTYFPDAEEMENQIANATTKEELLLAWEVALRFCANGTVFYYDGKIYNTIEEFSEYVLKERQHGIEDILSLLNDIMNDSSRHREWEKWISFQNRENLTRQYDAFSKLYTENKISDWNDHTWNENLIMDAGKRLKLPEYDLFCVNEDYFNWNPKTDRNKYLEDFSDSNEKYLAWIKKENLADRYENCYELLKNFVMLFSMDKDGQILFEEETWKILDELCQYKDGWKEWYQQNIEKYQDNVTCATALMDGNEIQMCSGTKDCSKLMGGCFIFFICAPIEGKYQDNCRAYLNWQLELDGESQRKYNSLGTIAEIAEQLLRQASWEKSCYGRLRIKKDLKEVLSFYMNELANYQGDYEWCLDIEAILDFYSYRGVNEYLDTWKRIQEAALSDLQNACVMPSDTSLFASIYEQWPLYKKWKNTVSNLSFFYNKELGKSIEC